VAEADSSQRPGSSWLIAVLTCAALGLGVAVYLTHVHLSVFYGAGVGDSLCDLGGKISCSTVNGAPESEIFGVPQSILAMPFYALAAALGLHARVKADRRASLLLVGLSLIAVIYSARLAWVSATVIGAWCLFCVALYAINLVLLGLGVAGSGAPVGRVLRETLLAPLRAPGLTGASVVGGALVLALALGIYGGFRDQMAGEAAKSALATPAAPARVAAPTNGAGEEKKVKVAAAKAEVTPPKDAPARGPARAPVTIVEWSDFQCPFCRRLSGTLRQLGDEYPNDVRVVYLNFPLSTDCNKTGLEKTMHPAACEAASAGVCADRQGKFWEMHDALFEHQAELKPKTYHEIAEEIGLDEAAFDACLTDPATAAVLERDTQLGAPLGVKGTPTFFVNGRQLSGAQPIEVLRAVVDAELKGSKELLDLSVTVGTEMVGAVPAGPDSAPVAALSGVQIDAFEASMDGARAVSKAGVEPARSVSWYDARDACQAAGKRLCTEREWLAACTGEAPTDPDHDGVWSDDDFPGRKYGYGDVRYSGVCADSRNPDAVGDLSTGTHPRCATPDGLYDLIGGVKEWVGLTPASAAVKGGSYSSGESARCGYYRDDLAPDTKDAATGFRCCSGAPDPAPPDVRPGRDVGEKLDHFTVPLQAGGTFDSRSIEGKPTILTFWASWCGPCQKEMPALAKLYQTYADKGLNVIGISVDEDDQKLSRWLDGHPMPFTIAHDPGGKLMDTFTNRGLPTTLWIRKDGTIRLRTTGVPPGADKRLDELVNELVNAG